MEDLKAGRELDALVGIRVIGFPSLYEDGIDQTEYEKRRRASYPEYSTDISAAWEVVDLLSKKGFSLYLKETNNHSISWECAFSKLHQPLDDECVTDVGTAHHAICLAALKAVEQ